MSYYSPYQNQGAKTSFGNYGPTSAVGNIGSNRSYADRAYGSPQGAYGAQRQNQGYNPGQQGGYQNPYSQQYNNPQQGNQGYQGGQQNPYGNQGFISRRGNAPQNPFSGGAGGGAMSGGGPLRGSNLPGRGTMSDIKQQRNQGDFQNRMGNTGDMQQMFGLMGLSPEQQQGYFQQYLGGPMAGMFGMGQSQLAGQIGAGNPFASGW